MECIRATSNWRPTEKTIKVAQNIFIIVCTAIVIIQLLNLIIISKSERRATSRLTRFLKGGKGNIGFANYLATLNETVSELTEGGGRGEIDRQLRAQPTHASEQTIANDDDQSVWLNTQNTTHKVAFD